MLRNRVLLRQAIFALLACLPVVMVAPLSFAQQDGETVLQRFMEDIRSLPDQTQNWSCSCVSHSWSEASPGGVSADALLNYNLTDDPLWLSKRNSYSNFTAQRFARSGIKHYTEESFFDYSGTITFEERESVDGVLFKRRYGASGSNGPAEDQELFEMAAPLSPAELAFFGLMISLPGGSSNYYLNESPYDVGQIQKRIDGDRTELVVTEESLKELDCYRVEIKTGRVVWVAWLAKSRGLLPIAINIDPAKGSSGQDKERFRIVEFQEQDVGDDVLQWFPKHTIRASVWPRNCTMTSTQYSVLDLHQNAQVFTDLDTLKLPALFGPGQLKLAASIPMGLPAAAPTAVVPPKPRRRTFSEQHRDTNSLSEFWHVGWVGLLVAILCWLLWYRHRAKATTSTKAKIDLESADEPKKGSRLFGLIKHASFALLSAAMAIVFVGLLLWASIQPSLLSVASLVTAAVFFFWLDRGGQTWRPKTRSVQIANRFWQVLTTSFCFAIFAILLASSQLGAPVEIASLCYLVAVIAILACGFRWLRNRKTDTGFAGVVRVAYLTFCIEASVISGFLAIMAPSWKWAGCSLLSLAFMVWIRHDLRLPEWLYKKQGQVSMQNLAGTSGIVLAVGLFAYLRTVPTWWEHGIASALTGLFGLAWIVVMMICVRARRFSLMMLISLCACSALLMSGYRGAADQILRRKRMIQQIADLGGKIERGRDHQARLAWYRTPEGLHLPSWVVDAVGDAATKTVTQITVPYDAARPEVFGRWTLDDLTSITLTGTPWERQSVDYRAIAVIPKAAPINFISFGPINAPERTIKELTKFAQLTDLVFGMDGQSIPPAAKDLQTIKRLVLHEPSIEESSAIVLREIESLQILTLIDPKFDAGASVANSLNLERIIVKADKIPADWAGWLCGSADEVLFIEATLASECFMSAATYFAGVDSLVFQRMTVKDKDLLRLVAAKNLNSIGILFSKASWKAVNEFSRQRPDVKIFVR